jgi:hypothetical protein
MTSQMMMSERVVSPSTSQAVAGSGTQENDDISSPANHSLRLLEKARAFYQEPQQEKFLNLQAETESLLLRLQLMKQKRVDSIQE